MIRPLLSWLIWLLLGSGLLGAENLVSVATRTLPAPAEAATVAGLGGLEQAYAVSASGVWQLDEAAGTWRKLRDLPDGTVGRGMISSARRLWALLGPTGADTIDRLVEIGGSPAAALPALPHPLHTAHGAVQGSSLFVAGTDKSGTTQGWSIDLSLPHPRWNPLPVGMPSARGISSLAAQDAALFVTAPADTGNGDELWRWTATDSWQMKLRLPGPVVGGAVHPLGQAHVLYLVRLPSGEQASARLQLFTYHTITSALAPHGQAWEGEVRRAAGWRNGLLWAREDGTLAHVQIQGRKHLLKPLDWGVIIGYLAGMVGIGLYFYLREQKQSTAAFFVGSRAIPFWAAGISLYATNTSSISYIAIPAKAFATNWQYLMNNLVAIIGLMFVATWIVPLLRRLDLMSVFHYLEIRFHPGIRTLTSALCIAMQLGGRMSVVLFLPSLAISTITGLDVVWSILIMGAVTIGYTAMGGMKAVIWTDFVQLFVMFGGALFAIGFIILKLDGGFGEFLSVAVGENKMRLADWSFDLTKATVWGFVFLVLFDVVLTFPKDQVLMQRVLSTKSDRDAGRSIWTFAAIMLPGGFMFYLIGTSLYVFYQAHPERMNPLLSTDATFPLFIAAELPVGITGLIIAGIFAASMSTLSSIINSVATLVSVDFYEKWARKPDPAVSVKVAEWMTVVAGLVGMGLALLLSRYDINSLFDVSIELSGLLSGGFAGAYTLGMFTRRANWQGVAIGIAVSIVLTVLAWSQNLVHPYFYMPISILICIVVGYLSSLFFPPPAVPLQGLTILRSGRPPAPVT